MKHLALALFGMACLGGCYSTTMLQDARVLPANRVRMAFAAGYTKTRYLHAPHVEAGLRVGVGEGIELQGKISDFGALGGAVKFSLLDDIAPVHISFLSGFQLAAVSEAVSAIDEPDNVGALNVMPMFGFAFGEDAAIVVAPDAHFGLRSGNGLRPWLGFGGRAGIAIHLSDMTTLLPECSLLAVAAGPPSEIESDGSRNRELTRGDVRWRCALGIGFGAAYAPPASTSRNAASSSVH